MDIDSLKYKHMQSLRKKFAEYGNPFSEGEYSEYRMNYDSGGPSKFWLSASANNAALKDLGNIIKV